MNAYVPIILMLFYMSMLCSQTVNLAIWKDSKKVAVKMMKEDTMSEDDFIDEAKTMK